MSDVQTVVSDAAEVATDVAELTSDVVDLVQDEAAQVVTVVKNNPVVLVGVALVAASVGAAIGYKVAAKRLQTRYDQIITEELEDAKKFYSRLNKTGEFATPEDAENTLAREAAEAMEQYQGTAEPAPVIESEITDYSAIPTSGEQVDVVINNVFVEGKPLEEDFPYDEEVPKRNPEHPYIISYEEFMNNEPEHEQEDVTYYEGDDIFADQRGQIMEDHLVDPDNLRWGYGSKDNKVVYVRNEKIGMDFQVMRSLGDYAEQVHGFGPADRQTVGRFRGDDG